MSAGRTTWWPKDAAWHRRNRQVKLGMAHGAAGPHILDVLCAWAQEQRASGAVKGGFAGLAHEAFVDLDDATRIVEHAASIGALDDLEVAGDEFTCRVSGWEADQARGRAAIKKADQRAGHVPPDGDLSPSEGDKSPNVPPTRPNQTTEQPSVGASPDATTLADVDPEVLRLCELLADLIAERDPKTAIRVKAKAGGKRWLTAMRLLVADRDGDIAEVERVLRWSQADSFWHANILSPGKLRDKFTELELKSRGSHLRPVPDPEREDRRARRSSALQRLLDDQEQGGDAA